MFRTLRLAALPALLAAMLQLPAAPAHALNVCGAISTNTTWTIANSPVNVTCDSAVFPGVTLNVDPGVQVVVSPNVTLAVRGTLNALGTSGSRIAFKSSSPPQLWGGIRFETSNGGYGTLLFTDVSHAVYGVQVQCCWGTPNPATIHDSTFSNNLFAVQGYTGYNVVIRRTTFSGNTYALDTADKLVYDSTFTNNGCGLCNGVERTQVYSSTFTGNGTAMDVRYGSAQNSTISGNGVGVSMQVPGFTLSKNTITSNGVGIKLPYGATSPISYNNIHSNSAYNAEVRSSSNQPMPYNFWGTTNMASIHASNRDGLDDISLGLIEYTPVLTQAVTLDTTPPDTSITSAPPSLSNALNAAFAFASTESPSTFQCQIDGGPFGSCTSPANYGGLSDGSHTFRVQATDNDANTDPTPAVHTWTIDTAPPDTAILTGPTGNGNPSSAAFTFGSEPGAAFECSLDGAAFSSCSSPQAYGSLGDGNHVFQVRAIDAAGNPDPSPATRSWHVDGSPPVVEIFRPRAPGLYVFDRHVPAGTDTPISVGPLTVTAQARDAGSGIASYAFTVDSVPVPPQDVAYDAPSGTFWFTLQPSPPGPREIAAVAVNGAGLSTTVLVTVIAA